MNPDFESTGDILDLDASVRRLAAAVGRGADSTDPNEDWIRARLLRFHSVADFGWRFSPIASLDGHRPLPESIAMFAPRGAASRLRALVRGGSGWIDLPHRPLR